MACHKKPDNQLTLTGSDVRQTFVNDRTRADTRVRVVETGSDQGVHGVQSVTHIATFNHTLSITNY